MYQIRYYKEALKDIPYLKASHLDSKVKELINILRDDPYRLPYEKLQGDLKGLYSRRINIKHRLVYSVDDVNKIVSIIKMWNHY